MFGGSARDLSMRACFPKAYAQERVFRSVLLGSVLALPRLVRGAPKPTGRGEKMRQTRGGVCGTPRGIILEGERERERE